MTSTPWPISTTTLPTLMGIGANMCKDHLEVCSYCISTHWLVHGNSPTHLLFSMLSHGWTVNSRQTNSALFSSPYQLLVASCHRASNTMDQRLTSMKVKVPLPPSQSQQWQVDRLNEILGPCIRNMGPEDKALYCNKLQVTLEMQEYWGLPEIGRNSDSIDADMYGLWPWICALTHQDQP